MRDRSPQAPSRIYLIGLLVGRSTLSIFATTLHGPILAWDADPLTTMNVIWIESGKTIDRKPAQAGHPSEIAVAASSATPRDRAIRTFLVENGRHSTILALRPVGQSKWAAVRSEARSFGHSPDTVRHVRLTGLHPASRYEFILSAEPDRTYSFRTPPEELTGPLTFVAGGDMGASPMAATMNRLAGRLDPAFALLGGDLAYANARSVEAWHDWLDSWSRNARTPEDGLVPVVVAIGNHETGFKLSRWRARDLGVPRNAQFFYSLFPLPNGRSNYTLDFGGYLSLTLLDSGHTRHVEDQAEWLDNSLKSNAEFPFRIVCYHRPAYGTAKKPQRDILERWVPLFEKHNVTAVFENDHHTLKRTHRIRQGRIDPSGILYLGDGAWGVEPRKIEDPEERWHLAHAASKNHLWLVTLEPGSISFQALGEDGAVLDRVP